MNKATRYNSILFLTTLCLGLVVGNSLSVSLSDLKSENELIEEFKSNSYLIDGSNSRHIDIPVLFVRLLSEIRHEVSSVKELRYRLPADFYVTGSSRVSSRSARYDVASNFSDQIFSSLFQNAVNKKFLPRLIDLSDQTGEYNRAAISINGDRADVVLNATFAKNDPEQYARLLNKKFSNRKNSVSGILRLAYRNTLATVENNQVLVITRLPRASIDSFINGE